jgi:LuxR family maltose regulon positive regulatory protein
VQAILSTHQAPKKAIDTTLIRAKLSPPQPAADQIIRQRLVDALDRQAPAGRLIILSAPPGYGKTTLAAQWLSTRDVPGAWLTIDDLDNDLGSFVGYLVAAMKTAYPHAGRHTGSLMNAPQAVPPSALADALIEDLASLPGALVLVLDDYYRVTDSEVEAFMARLVQFLPTNIQIMLTTRSDPAMPLTRLRGLGQIAEFRAGDLQFSNDETRRLLSNLTGEPVDDQAATLLGRRMEGWAIGLRFAALARRENESLLSLAQRFAREGQGVTSDYLLEEVLAKQPPDVQDFLLRTAILERLSERLCTAVTGQAAGRGMLDRLWRANLLITPLDDQRTWFRYHSLFRELLLRWLYESYSTETVGALHRRTAVWLGQEGLIGEALSHAVAANDKALAVRLVDENITDALNREQWWRIARWLDLLPEHFRDHPALLVAQGWVLNFQLRIRALAGVTSEAGRRLDEAGSELMEVERDLLRVQIEIMNAVGAYWSGDAARSARLAEGILSRLRPDMVYVRSMYHLYYTGALGSTGQGERARRYVQGRLAEQTEQLPTMTARLLMAMNLLQLQNGEIPSFRDTMRLLERVGTQGRLPASIGWSQFGLGMAAYQWNDLDTALSYWQAAVQTPFEINSRAAYESFIGLALTLDGQGKHSLADDSVEHLRDFLLETNFLEALPLVEALTTRLALARGRSVPVVRLEPPAPAEARLDLRRSFLLSALLTDVRVLLHDPSDENLTAAREFLAICRQAAEQLHEWRHLIEIGALESLCFDAMGDQRHAQDALVSSLKLAEPGRIVRPFIDCGLALLPLLHLIHERGTAPAHARLTLDAFATATATQGDDIRATNEDTLMALRSVLTNREIDVLNLLGQRLSNQEIADRLYVEPETIKKHLQNVYRKLGVNNRRGAIALAHRVGLLT